MHPQAQFSNVLSLKKMMMRISQQQQRQFGEIENECSSVDGSLFILEQTCQRLQQRLQKFGNRMQNKKLGELRKQQDQFIIRELKTKLQKIAGSEQEVHQKLLKSEAQVTSLHYKIHELQQKVQIMKKYNSDKDQRIGVLVQEIKKVKKSVNTVQVAQTKQNPKQILQNYEYLALSQKLSQMQECMNMQIKSLKGQVKKLQDEKTRLQQKMVHREMQVGNSKYELQLKVNYLTKTNTQLYYNYQQLIKKSGETEVSLHQLIKQLKGKYQKEKKNTKQQQQHTQKAIRKFGIQILQIDKNKMTIIMGKGTLQEQLGQIKKELEKEKKKNINMANLQRQSIIEQMHSQLNAKRRRIKELQDKIERKKKDSVNSSNRSHDISDDKIRNAEKIKVQLQNNNATIQKLKKQIDEQQNEYIQSKLEKQREISVLTNKIKYMETEHGRQASEKDKKLLDINKCMQRMQVKNKKSETQYTNKIQEVYNKYVESIQTNKEKQGMRKQLQKKVKQGEQGRKKDVNKLLAQLSQCQRVIGSKEKIIDELIHKNQAKNIQLKLLTEKNKILQLSLAQQNTKGQTGINRDLQQQIQMQKERIFQRISLKEQEILEKEKTLEEEILKNATIVDKLKQYIIEVEKGKQLVQNQNKVLMKQLKESSGIQYSKMQQLRNQIREKEKIINTQNVTIFKERQEHNRAIRNKDIYSNQILQKLKQMENQSIKSNIQIVPKKNNIIKPIRGTNSFEMIDCGTMTQPFTQVINNMQIPVLTISDTKTIKTSNKQQYDNILDFISKEKSVSMQQQMKNESQSRKEQQNLKTSNLFQYLDKNGEANENAFQICDEEQQINFGQSASNLQVRQIFNYMRRQIQKIFNDQELSVNALKQLPSSLQDDFLQFTTYIRQKIFQIKSRNEISFIMAQVGDQPQEPSQCSLQLPTMLEQRVSSKQLAKLIQQKQALINNLMSQKTQQQNTINQLTMQKEEIEQENENRFMNQCNVYKREVKELKKIKDLLQMNFQSLKNITKNILQAYSDEYEMEDDYRDGLQLFAKVAKLSEKEKSRLNYHIKRYQQIKNIQ